MLFCLFHLFHVFYFFAGALGRLGGGVDAKGNPQEDHTNPFLHDKSHAGHQPDGSSPKEKTGINHQSQLAQDLVHPRYELMSAKLMRLRKFTCTCLLKALALAVYSGV